MDDDFIDELMDDEENGSLQIEEPQNSENDLIEDHLSEENLENLEQLEGDDSFISDLLKSRGIEDLSKIKFENDEGEIEEVNWNTLSKEDKLNIFNSSAQNPEIDLDEFEILLINTIRQSLLTPSEYILYVLENTILNYLQNNQSTLYKVDELTDDELFVADLVARTNVTEEEAFDALDKFKSNPDLFKKQIDGIRSEYLKSEEERFKYDEIKRLEELQEQFNIFANGIVNEITNFTEFAGCDLNMNNEDKQELYEFITGFDSAGNSHFGKALNDPNLLVKMAWFALNGEQMILDINDYYKKEIASVRKESYNKGLKDKNKPSFIHKPINNTTKSEIYDDLD